MKKKDQVELDVANALAAARTVIRMKHTQAANAELNEVLPALKADMERAAITGKPYQLNLASLLA